MHDDTATDAASLDLLSPEVIEDPYPLYHLIRSTEPVLFIEPFNAWILTRFDDVRTAFTDPRFQVRYEQAQVNRIGPAALDQDYFQVGRDFLVVKDPPEHTRLKRVFRQPFTATRARELVPLVEQLAHECIDGFADAGRADVVTDYAHRVPLGIMSRLLDVPPADEPMIINWVQAFYAALFVSPMTTDELAAANRTARAAQDYFLDVMRRRRSKPGDDFVSDLLAANGADQTPMTDAQIASNLFLLYFAGHDTQQGMFSNIVAALDRDPDARRFLLDDTKRIPACIHELYRYDTTGQFMGRTVSEDVAMGNATIRGGQSVMVCMGAANRDPEVFPDPDRIDFNRDPAIGTDLRHLTFGMGRHHCLGAQMAQTNLPIMLGALLDRVGDFACDFAAAQRLPSMAARAYEHLPITWSP